MDQLVFSPVFCSFNYVGKKQRKHDLKCNSAVQALESGVLVLDDLSFVRSHVMCYEFVFLTVVAVTLIFCSPIIVQSCNFYAPHFVSELSFYPNYQKKKKKLIQFMST